MEKITKKDMFKEIKNAYETGVFGLDKDVVTAFCDKEIAALDAKAAKAKERAAAKKAENDELTDIVASVLTDEYQSLADITAAVSETVADVTTSKIVSRLTKLIDAKAAEKTQITIPGVDGGKSRKAQGYKRV